MKLARKLIAALLLGIFTVMAGYAYLQFRQEVVLFEADFQRARQVGLAWLGTVEAVWQREGPERVIELVDRANKRATEVNIRLLALDEPIAGLPQLVLTMEDMQALRNDAVVRVLRSDDNGEWRDIYAAMKVGKTHPAAVELIEPLKEELHFVHMSHLAIALATLAIVVVCGVIATGIQVSFVGRPLQQLRDKARRAGNGDFSRPLVLRQRDEIGELAEELNGMCERLAAANRSLEAATEARIAAVEQLRHTDRLATVGRLAAGVAHELGTPLSVVSARAQLLVSNEMPRGDVVKNADIIIEQSNRMTEIIQQLLDFSRRRGVHLGLANLQRIVMHTLDLLSTVAERSRVRLRCDAPEKPILAHVDQHQLEQALTNMILNGIQAMPEGGQLSVRVGLQRVRPPTDFGTEAEYPYITVEDQGTGITPERIPHIFEPFFTTKAPGEGTGLGLAVAHGIVTEHGGWITVQSAAGQGSRFSIFLPQPAAATPQDLEVAS